MTSEEIRRLIEFYFGDINMSRDQFNRQLIKSNNNKVSLELINTTFPKLKAMNVSVQQIKDALASSTTLSVSDDNYLSRKVPFDENANFDDQAVYVKGLPRGIQLAQIFYFFKSFDVSPELVVFHKNLKNVSKGSFELFLGTKDDQKKLLQAFGNQEHEDQRWEASAEFFKKQTIQRDKEDFLMPYQAFLLKNLVVIPLKTFQEDQKTEETKEQEKQEAVRTYVKGLIVKITNIGSDGDISRQTLQTKFQKYGEIKYIDYQQGEPTAFVRFKESSPNAALQACQENEKENFKLGGSNVQLGVLQSKEEEDYWSKILQAGERKWQQKKKGGAKK